MTKKLMAMVLVGFLWAFAMAYSVTAVAFQHHNHKQGQASSQATLWASASLQGRADSQDGFVPSHLFQSDNPTGNRQVVGDDDRLPVTSRAYPWSAIGRLEQVDARGRIVSICTGSLIGYNLVLTNAHCVVDERTNRLTRDTLRFRPNLIDDRSRLSAVARQVHYGDSGKNGFFGEDDWALIRLDQPLGRQQGTIGWRSLTTQGLRQLAGQLNLVGYSADFPPNRPGRTAGVHRGCNILGDGDFGFLIHDCDTFGGASGSPVLAQINGKFYIVALHAGTYNRVNRAIRVSRWAPSAIEMLQ
ncbi:MAG: trypsin-like peptidase domain-containing protein [Cyanobacteria bacterium]|nr:trypsin-like peptidase domain-containing protein [Cyanobacteriota bacterium]MDW8201395.1 trypsin-like peptidase domain-containing protein [Cyanobacteriota bacterium SKYGB_h_bin112]